MVCAPLSAPFCAPRFAYLADQGVRGCAVTPWLPSQLAQMEVCDPCTIPSLIETYLGVDEVNTLIAAGTVAASGAAGRLSSPGPFATMDFTVEPDMSDPPTCLTCDRLGHIRFAVTNMTLDGLDTLASVQLLQPSSAHVLHNLLTTNGSRPVALSFDVRFQVDGTVLDDDGVTLHIDDTFRLSFSLQNWRVLLDIMLMVDKTAFWNIPVGRLNDYTAYLQALAAARPAQLDVSAERVALDIDCDIGGGCTSPLVRQLAANLRLESSVHELTASFNHAWQAFSTHFVDNPLVQRQYDRTLAAYSQLAAQRVMKNSSKSECFDLADPGQCSFWQSVGQCTLNSVWMNLHCQRSCGVCAPVVVGPDASSDRPSLQLTLLLIGLALVGIGLVVLGFRHWWHQVQLAEAENSKLQDTFRHQSNTTACMTCCYRRFNRAQARLSTGLDQRLMGSHSSGAPGSDSADTSSILNASVTEAAFNGDKTESLPCKPQGNVALCFNPHLPLLLRLGIPVALAINVLSFITGHLTIGSTVDVAAQLAGDTVRVDRFVEFSLGHSLLDLWNAKAYTLFYMVAGFSGVWPYVKLLVILTCWCAPLSARRRESVLHKCEYFGTWSLIDLYVLVMLMLAFHMHIVSPTSLSFVPVNFYVLDLMLTPVWGLYGFILGVCLSILLNYVVLRAHCTAVRAERAAQLGLSTAKLHLSSDILSTASSHGTSFSTLGSEELISTADRSGLVDDHTRLGLAEKEALSAHLFDGQGSLRYRFTLLGHIGMVALLLGATGLVLIGSFMNSFSFRSYGIAGYLVELGQPGGSIRQYSLLSSTAELFAQTPARYGGYLGIASIAIVYVSFALLVPIAVLLVAVVQWFVPLTLRHQRRLEALSEALHAWSALEVFIVAIAVAMAQMELVSGFVVGGPCKQLHDTFNTLEQYRLLPEAFFPTDSLDEGVLVDTPPTGERTLKKGLFEFCFVIKASSLRGLWVLLLGATLSSVACRIVTSLTRAAIANRERRAELPQMARSSSAAAWTEGAGDSAVAELGCRGKMFQCVLLSFGCIRRMKDGEVELALYHEPVGNELMPMSSASRSAGSSTSSSHSERCPLSPEASVEVIVETPVQPPQQPPPQQQQPPPPQQQQLQQQQPPRSQPTQQQLSTRAVGEV
jgi:hypothetical protein